MGIFTIFSGTAQAEGQQGVMFSPSFIFSSYNDRASGSSFAQVSGQYIDVRLGYVMPSGLYLGGIYDLMNRTDFTTERKRSSYGASLGMVYNGFVLIGSYLISSEFETSSGTTLKSGSGLQVDLGYLFNVTGSFFAGPQLVYRSITYTKQNSTTVTSTDSTETIPYVTLAFLF